MPYKSGTWGEKAKKRSLTRNEYHKAYQRKHLKKKNARASLWRAIRKGTITKQPCRDCGSLEKVNGHHFDYNKPLDVIWLCPFHHREEHKINSPINGDD